MRGVGSSDESSNCRRARCTAEIHVDPTKPQCRRTDSDMCCAKPSEKHISPTPSVVPPPRRVDSFTSYSSLDENSDREALVHDDPPQVLSVDMFSMYATGECVFTGDEDASSREDESYCSQQSKPETKFQSPVESTTEDEINKTLDSKSKSVLNQRSFDDEANVILSPAIAPAKQKHRRVKTLPAAFELDATPCTDSDRGMSAAEIKRTGTKPSPMIPKPAHRRNNTLPTLTHANLDTCIGSFAPPELSRPHKRLTAHTTLGEMMEMCGDASNRVGAKASTMLPKQTHRRVKTLPTSIIAEMVGTNIRSDPFLPRSGLPPRPNTLRQKHLSTTLSPHAPLRNRVPNRDSKIDNSAMRTHTRSCSAPIYDCPSGAVLSSLADFRESAGSGLPSDACSSQPALLGFGHGLEGLSQIRNFPNDGINVPDPKLLAGRRRHNRSQSHDSRTTSGVAGSLDKNSPEYCWSEFYEKQMLKKNVVKEEIKYRLGKVVPKQFFKRAQLQRANSAKFV